jgi:hypothetical protein
MKIRISATGDTLWDNEGELYLAYDLHLDGDADEQIFSPDEERCGEQDMIFDYESVISIECPMGAETRRCNGHQFNARID